MHQRWRQRGGRRPTARSARRTKRRRRGKAAPDLKRELARSQDGTATRWSAWQKTNTATRGSVAGKAKGSGGDSDTWIHVDRHVDPLKRLLERLTDGLRYQVANDIRIEEVELEFEFGEGGSDERLEIRIGDEEVEEDVLRTQRVSENRMDDGDRSSEVLDVESNGDVDGRSGRTAISDATMSQESIERTEIQQEYVNMCDTAATSGASTSGDGEAFLDFTEAFIPTLPLNSREEALTWAQDTAAKCDFFVIILKSDAVDSESAP
ncbi:hypothetical protein Scep_021901 [Stephania cephalantha]|uniref:Uncharacterized protein n=1 Tax=Stephania cephalantha TaxID=152367 RepID=A0AAP0I0K6_9MAGN